MPNQVIGDTFAVISTMLGITLIAVILSRSDQAAQLIQAGTRGITDFTKAVVK